MKKLDRSDIVPVIGTVLLILIVIVSLFGFTIIELHRTSDRDNYRTSVECYFMGEKVYDREFPRLVVPKDVGDHHTEVDGEVLYAVDCTYDAERKR